MHRRVRLFGFIALVALFGMGIAGMGRATATATAPAGSAGSTFAEVALAPGVTAGVYSAVPSARAPEQTLYLARFVYEPGSEMFAHTQPGTVSLTVAEGRLGWTLVAGTAHLVRGAEDGAIGSSELIDAPGTEVILQPGDVIYYEDDVVHTARATGEQPAVVLGTLLLTTGKDLVTMPTVATDHAPS